MSANVIIFDGMYTADQMRNIDKAKNLVEEATQEIKRTIGSHSWKCPEARTIDTGLNSAVSRLTRLNQGLIRTGIALGNGLKGFTELEDRAANQADGLASDLKEKTGFTASTGDGGETTLGCTAVPGTGAVPPIIARIREWFKRWLELIRRRQEEAERKRKEQQEKLDKFFYENFPWLKEDDDTPVAPTPPQVGTTEENPPVQEPEQTLETEPEPVIPTAPGGSPDFDSGAYDVNIPGVNKYIKHQWYVDRGKTGYEYDSNGVKHINCLYYARARAMEANGLSEYQSYPNSGTSTEIRSNSVAYFHNSDGSFSHAVYVERYDPETQTVYFTEGNWGTDPDGQMKECSLEKFKTRGGYIANYDYYPPSEWL